MSASPNPARDAIAALRGAYADRLAGAQRHQRAGGRVVAYLCDNVPIELIVAADAFPLRIHPEPGQGTATAARLIDPLYPAEVSQRPDFVGSMLGRILEGAYAFVDAIIVPHNRNAVQAIHRALADAERAHCTRTPETWYLDKAWSPHAEARSYNLAAVDKLRRRLEAHIGRAIDEDALRSAVKQVNRARYAVRRLAALRIAGTLRGSLGIELIGAFYGLPPADYADLVEAALPMLLADDAGTLRPLYLGGSPLDRPDLYVLVERLGGTVVDEDHCWGSRAGDDPVAEEGSAIVAIGERFHTVPACSIRVPLQRVIEANTARALRSGAGDAVMYVMAGDVAQAWETPEQLTALRDAGLRVLHLASQPHDATHAEGLNERLGSFLAETGDD